MSIWEYFSKEIRESGIGFFSLMAIVIGSILPVLIVKPKTRGDVALMIFSGIASATFFGSSLTNYFSLKGQTAAAVHFLVALGGMFIIKGIMVIYKKFSESPFSTIWQFINMYMKFKKDDDFEEETNTKTENENEENFDEEVVE